ncbi:MAG: hypothetical protein ACD_40C00217G0005 [uncultured bacterium]|nr:MAG: hypothetical protein ACD_40C00217G0005 [uncultured bacterium]
MSSVILINWTVYYSDDATADNGYKQIKSGLLMPAIKSLGLSIPSVSST